MTINFFISLFFIIVAFNISSNVTLGKSGKCDSSYPDVCISPPPPDLNCPDVAYEDFKVLPPDPHGFDKDGNGIGCESQLPP
jgi:hypothetical protein